MPSRDLSNWKKFHELFATAFIHEALGAVAELGIADALGEKPLSLKEIAEELHLHEDSLYRTMRALSAYGIFEELEGRRFKHNAFSLQLRQDHPDSFRGMAVLWHSDPLRKAWGHFTSALRDGQSAFQHGNGMSLYHYLNEQPAIAQLFHQAMENNSAVVADSIAQGFPFGDYGSILDLGGGIGTTLAAILKKHRISGAVLDLPLLSKMAQVYLEKHVPDNRALFIEGDWFVSVPKGYGLYLVKNSLWNWTDRQCANILTNIRAAMEPGARLLILEYLAKPLEAPWTTAFDLQQLNVTGGRGRTRAEYASLLRETGFTLSSVFQIENQDALLCRP